MLRLVALRPVVAIERLVCRFFRVYGTGFRVQAFSGLGVWGFRGPVAIESLGCVASLFCLQCIVGPCKERPWAIPFWVVPKIMGPFGL